MYGAFVKSAFFETKMKTFFRRLEDYLQAGHKQYKFILDRKL